MTIEQHEDFAARRAAIAQERRALDERETTLMEDELTADEAEHVELVTRCRAEKDAADALRSEIERAQMAYRTENRKVSDARFHLEQYRSYGPKPVASNYPTPEEKAEWENGLRALVTALEAAEEIEAQAWAAVDVLQHKRREAHGDFERLADDERDMRSRLRSRRDEITRRKPFASAKHDPYMGKATFVYTTQQPHSGAMNQRHLATAGLAE